MLINISRRELVEGLRKVSGPTTTKQGFPALSSVLVEADKKKIKLTTTDLDITLTTQIKTTVLSAGKMLVPMRNFIAIARELPPADITLERVKNILSIRCGKTEFKINTISEEEFPKTQERKEAITVRLLPEVLEEMINLTSFCVGYEDVNYVLSGVLFELEQNQIRLVATDGKRLSCVVRDLPKDQAEIKERIAFILPSKTVGEIEKLAKDRQDPAYLSFSENTVGLDFGETKIISRPIEGEFPNYSQYIPKEKGNQLSINRENFIASLRRVGLLTTAEFQGVRLNLKKNKLLVYKKTPQLGEGKEELESKYQGPALEIEFNPNYLLDVLKHLVSPEVVIDFFGAEKPAVLKEEGYTYLLLPIKS